MPEVTQKSVVNESILKALLYSDIFHYPLTADEIFQRMPSNHVTLHEVNDQLKYLKEKGLVYQHESVFAIQNSNTIFLNRVRGNKLAEEMMPMAMRRANLIYQFPFVRAVMISGSLSKNFADEKSDVDYFIVTRPGRVWLARTLLATFQKVFLLNSKKYFCLNYFVDDVHLKIEEQNIFTATELATLIPVCGFSYHQQLCAENKWILSFLPNFANGAAPYREKKITWFKNTAEAILSAPLFDSLDKWFMQMTSRHWQKLYERKYPSADFQIAFKSTPHVAKSHPDFHQRRVTEVYQQNVARFFQKIQSVLHG